MDPFPKFEKYQGTLWKEELMPVEEAFTVAKRQGYDKEEFSMDASMVWDARKKLKEYPRLIYSGSVVFLRILTEMRKALSYMSDTVFELFTSPREMFEG